MVFVTKSLCPSDFKENDTEVNISNINDLHIPDEILKMKNLKKIKIQYCNITEIPEIIFQIDWLEMLYIFDCNLEHISENIINLKNLKALGLARNNLKYIPECLSKIVNLLQLGISDNPINELPESLFTLPNLQEFCIDNTNIQTLSDNIINLNKIYYFTYQFTNIQNISEKIMVWMDKIKIVKKNEGVDLMKYARQLCIDIEPFKPCQKNLIIKKSSNLNSNIDDLGVFADEDIAEDTVFFADEEIYKKINDLAWNNNMHLYATKENILENTNVKFLIECDDPAFFILNGEYRKVYLKSIKYIKKGDELSRLYGTDYWKNFNENHNSSIKE